MPVSGVVRLRPGVIEIYKQVTYPLTLVREVR